MDLLLAFGGNPFNIILERYLLQLFPSYARLRLVCAAAAAAAAGQFDFFGDIVNRLRTGQGTGL